MATSRCVILVVDDDTLIRSLIEETLILLGYDVITAESGDAALPIIASAVMIDVVITDIVMPGEMNGFDLIEQAKAMRPGIHTIAMSGFVAKHGEKIAITDRFLHKPFTISTLDRALQSLTLDTCLQP